MQYWQRFDLDLPDDFPVAEIDVDLGADIEAVDAGHHHIKRLQRNERVRRGETFLEWHDCYGAVDPVDHPFHHAHLEGDVGVLLLRADHPASVHLFDQFLVDSGAAGEPPIQTVGFTPGRLAR